MPVTVYPSEIIFPISFVCCKIYIFFSIGKRRVEMMCTQHLGVDYETPERSPSFKYRKCRKQHVSVFIFFSLMFVRPFKGWGEALQR